MLTLQLLCWHENHTSWCDFCNGAKLRRADLESETSHTGWLTATLRWSVYKYSDRSGSKWVGVSTGTHWDGRKYSDMWELGFSLPERLGQSFRRHDVRGVYTTCSSWGLLPFILYRTAFHVGKKCFPVWCKHSLIHANFLKFDPRINFSQKNHSYYGQYLLSVLFWNLFTCQIYNGRPRAMRVHWISQRQLQESSNHADHMTRVTQRNGKSFIIHS